MTARADSPANGGTETHGSHRTAGPPVPGSRSSWYSLMRATRPLRRSRFLQVFLGLVSIAFFLHSAWIPVKAEVAQWLIERSWQQCRAGPDCPPPWPWADTRPAAILEAPAHGERLVILEGNSGRNLAFGPVLGEGAVNGSDLVISGHRDTHFRFLQRLAAGDRIVLTRGERVQEFEVMQLDIVDSRDVGLAIEPGLERLSLVTCYPFDAPLAGGPLRYVVTAVPLG